MAPSPPTARRPLGLRKRLAFIGVSLLLAGLALEALTYLGYWAVVGKPFSWSELDYDRRSILFQMSARQSIVAQVHPYVGYVMEPMPDSGVTPFGGEQPVPVSDFGYIDAQLPIGPRDDDAVRVAITGGSVACYFAVNGTDRLAAELRDDPRFAGRRFEFRNLALGGYKQPQQLMTLAYLLALGAKFDVVVNIDGFNEVGLHELENAAHQVFPAFPRSWQARVEVADPRMGRLQGKIETHTENRLALATAFNRPPWRYSVVASVLWILLDRKQDNDVYRLKEKFWQTTPSLQRYVVTGPTLKLDSEDALYDHLAGLWRESSTQMDRLCRNNGILYYHVLQPNQYVAGSKPMGPEEQQTAILEKHPYRHAVEVGYPKLIREGAELQKRGVPFTDLTGLFAGTPEAIYIDGCCHYNREGYQLLAGAIARAIRADGERRSTAATPAR